MTRVKELYVLARYKDGEFVEYVRKGRNHSISGYDNITGARRGCSQSLKAADAHGYELKIMKADILSFVD
jgi:hypothetical protein